MKLRYCRCPSKYAVAICRSGDRLGTWAHSHQLEQFAGAQTLASLRTAMAGRPFWRGRWWCLHATVSPVSDDQCTEAILTLLLRAIERRAAATASCQQALPSSGENELSTSGDGAIASWSRANVTSEPTFLMLAVLCPDRIRCAFPKAGTPYKRQVKAGQTCLWTADCQLP